MATFDEEGKGQKSQSFNTHANMRSIYKGNRERKKDKFDFPLNGIQEAIFSHSLNCIQGAIFSHSS